MHDLPSSEVSRRVAFISMREKLAMAQHSSSPVEYSWIEPQINCLLRIQLDDIFVSLQSHQTNDLLKSTSY